MKKFFLLFLIVFLFCPLNSRAAVLKNGYPRLANYFLHWEISDAEASELAKWDLLVLDLETAASSQAQIKKIRSLNSQVIILAYITPQEIVDNPGSLNNSYYRQKLINNIDASWWLKNSRGESFSNWPWTTMLNLSNSAGLNNNGERWNDYLARFVADEVKASGLFDGVFYDNIWGDISWLNAGDLDLNNDGIRDKTEEANLSWQAGVKKLLIKTKELAGNNFLIVVNGQTFEDYQKITNGLMLEKFPTPWENGGTWSGAMNTYIKLPLLNLNPSLGIINATDKDQNNYKYFRYGLTSALLGDGYYSFDYDITNHGQTWWYDEYNIKLGPAQSTAYNVLDKNKGNFTPGLWRRDFKYGTVLVNSSKQDQRYVFSKEEFNKIKGNQDPAINSGLKINYLKLAANDGVVLLKVNTLIRDNPFINGYFYRSFTWKDLTRRSGFFSYLNNFPGAATIIVAANDDAKEVSLSGSVGQIGLYKNGTKLLSFYPYQKNYTGSLNLSAQIDQGLFKLVVVGAGAGGGPQVRLFSPNGQLKASFFAYDKNLRGGVNVALGDVDQDKQLEIITGPGRGSEPLIKIFNLQGQLEKSWLAYDQKFRGGVNVAVGDVNSDGQLEIITGPGEGGGPQVRIFSGSGEALFSFFAYDASYHGGIKVAVSDLNYDNQAEILVGIKNFY